MPAIGHDDLEPAGICIAPCYLHLGTLAQATGNQAKRKAGAGAHIGIGVDDGVGITGAYGRGGCGFGGSDNGRFRLYLFNCFRHRNGDAVQRGHGIAQRKFSIDRVAAGCFFARPGKRQVAAAFAGQNAAGAVQNSPDNRRTTCFWRGTQPGKGGQRGSVTFFISNGTQATNGRSAQPVTLYQPQPVA